MKKTVRRQIFRMAAAVLVTVMLLSMAVVSVPLTVGAAPFEGEDVTTITLFSQDLNFGPLDQGVKGPGVDVKIGSFHLVPVNGFNERDNAGRFGFDNGTNNQYFKQMKFVFTTANETVPFKGTWGAMPHTPGLWQDGPQYLDLRTLTLENPADREKINFSVTKAGSEYIFVLDFSETGWLWSDHRGVGMGFWTGLEAGLKCKSVTATFVGLPENLKTCDTSAPLRPGCVRQPIFNVDSGNAPDVTNITVVPNPSDPYTADLSAFNESLEVDGDRNESLYQLLFNFSVPAGTPWNDFGGNIEITRGGETTTIQNTHIMKRNTDKYAIVAEGFETGDNPLGLTEADSIKFVPTKGGDKITIDSIQGVFFNLPEDMEPPIPVESVTLDKTELNLKPGEEETLVATVAPENAGDKTVTWWSSDEDIATVDENGKVTGVAPGSATITAAANDGSGKSAACVVTVGIPVESVSLNKSELALPVGGREALVATVTPEDATNKKVTWSSSDTDIATVDENGKVTGVALGMATITVTTEDGGFTDTCEVTVKELAISDAVKALRYIADMMELTEDQIRLYDLDSSGRVDIKDVVLILRQLAGIG